MDQLTALRARYGLATMEQPRYDLVPGRSVLLYKGPAEMTAALTPQIDVEATVTFDWHVGTRASVRSESDLPTRTSEHRVGLHIPGVERLEDLTVLHDGPHRATGSTAGYNATLHLNAATFGRPDEPVVRVITHICNLPPRFTQEPDLSTLSLDRPGWSVRLHALPDAEQRYRDVKLNGGGAVTHLLVTERDNGAPFRYDDARHIHDALRQMLNFAYGRRIAFLLPTGLDKGDEQVFTVWGDPQRHDQTGGLPWFTHRRSSSLRLLWPQWLEKWQSKNERDGIVLAIGLYVDAHRSVPLESRILLTFAILEMLSWQWLRDEGGLSRRQVKGLDAAARLRKTLDGMGVSAAVPKDLEALVRHTSEQDGPGVLNWLRNRLAHAKQPGALLRVPNAVKVDAWRLGLWYVDLIMFHRMGFIGDYLNRTRSLPLEDWATELPPWVTTH